ncbi:Phytochrome C [Zea mays]|uniref:Phytochrome C n=1 Tax=Zea mays TaxID=4577 RepID=A0A3L6EPI0_MAIZE|nr:Phytochrome C [Zea mays]
MSSPSNNRGTCSRSSSARSKHSARVVAQTPVDAQLHADFEGSQRHFDYSSSVGAANRPSASTSTVSTYLQNMQRGRYIQPFGCLLAVQPDTFALLAYSENAPEMLDLTPHAVPTIDQRDALTIGADVRTLFRSQSSVALHKAATFGEVNLLNPILVHARTSGKPFYAILHRIDVGLVIDLEPFNPADVPVTAAGALKSYKLAAKAISRLQSLPSGNLSLLCDVLVREVSELTGYDRVMAYKFHEDEHVLIIQDGSLAQPLSLCGSTLRASHGCHAQYMANMGSVASLVMSVTINDDEEEDGDTDSDQQPKGRKLWGLVVCHHTSPRFVPFPLRYACEFLLQVFGIQLSKEVELAAQAKERHILRTQTLLCDMLLRDALVGIFTQSPNVMDLVKCDGAALYYQNQVLVLGSTPSESEIKSIATWLQENHDGSTGLSTDSLVEAGYPGAAALREVVCGMVAIKISSKNFIFWFRSHTTKEIKWSGAKHEPFDADDNGRKMHPRSSFKAFLEVVKWRSVPWEDVEMDAIHSLQLILRDSLQGEDANRNNIRSIVKAPSDDMKKLQGLLELRTVTNEMVRLIETATAPVLAVDIAGNINGWNKKAAELTGLPVMEAIGRPLIDLVVADSVEVVKQILDSALQGIEEQNLEIKLKTFHEQECCGPVILMINSCCSRDLSEKVIGVCFVAQDLTRQKMIMDKYTRIQGDYVAIIKNPSELIPPIFMINDLGSCLEWNKAMQKITGMKREDAINKLLIGEVFTLHDYGCRVKDHATLTKLSILMNAVISGQDPEKLLFGFFGTGGKYIESLLTVNKRTNAEGKITGALCFLHVASPELQHALEVQKMSEQAATNSFKELTYIRQELRNPLNGIQFTYNLLKPSELTEDQRQLVSSNVLCQDQLKKILHDTDLESIEQCYMETNTVEFNLEEALNTVLMQGIPLGKEKRISIERDWPVEVSHMYIYGDNIRLQQVLADYLACALQFTQPAEGHIVLQVIPKKENIGSGMQIAHLEFRIVHPAPGVPEALIQEMFQHNPGVSREGLGLYISQKLVKTMSGTLQYLREADTSSFIILIEFPVAQLSSKRSKPSPRLVRWIVEEVAAGRSPSIVLHRYRNYCSSADSASPSPCACSYDVPVGTDVLSLLHKDYHTSRLNVLLRVLFVVQQLLQQNKHCSKRDIYYMYPSIFVEVAVVDRAINDICILFKCSRHNLNVVPVVKGNLEILYDFPITLAVTCMVFASLVMGWIRFMEGEKKVYCITSVNAAFSIPVDIEAIKDVVSVAHYILVVEKETVFQRLANDKFCERNRCIVITIGGKLKAFLLGAIYTGKPQNGGNEVRVGSNVAKGCQV